MTNSITASIVGSWAMALARMVSSSPFPLVVKLKTMLPVTAVKVMIANTRAITEGGRSSILALRLAGASSSRGTSTTKATAQIRQMTPGMTKAICQPKRWAM